MTVEDFLKSHPGEYFTPGAIARKLNLPINEVKAEIEGLEGRGEISSWIYKGQKLYGVEYYPINRKMRRAG